MVVLLWVLYHGLLDRPLFMLAVSLPFKWLAIGQLLTKDNRIQLNWQVKPLPDDKCTFRPQNFIVLAILNVMSDAALLSIPLPILQHLRVSKKRKLGVSILLSSGVFVISTAVVRVVLTLTGEPTVITINLWGFRELGVGLIAVTTPIIYPVFTPEFWRPGPYVRDNRRGILQPSMHIPSSDPNVKDIELQMIEDPTTLRRYRD